MQNTVTKKLCHILYILGIQDTDEAKVTSTQIIHFLDE